MYFYKLPLFTKFRFVNPNTDKGHLYSFSTDLEKIGIENNVSIQNGIYVDVISDPTIINVPKYGGDISVVKVRADVATDYHTIIEEFWIPTHLVVKVELNAIKNPQLSN